MEGIKKIYADEDDQRRFDSDFFRKTMLHYLISKFSRCKYLERVKGALDDCAILASINELEIAIDVEMSLNEECAQLLEKSRCDAMRSNERASSSDKKESDYWGNMATITEECLKLATSSLVEFRELTTNRLTTLVEQMENSAYFSARSRFLLLETAVNAMSKLIWKVYGASMQTVVHEDRLWTVICENSEMVRAMVSIHRVNIVKRVAAFKELLIKTIEWFPTVMCVSRIGKTYYIDEINRFIDSQETSVRLTIESEYNRIVYGSRLLCCCIKILKDKFNATRDIITDKSMCVGLPCLEEYIHGKHNQICSPIERVEKMDEDESAQKRPKIAVAPGIKRGDSIDK